MGLELALLAQDIPFVRAKVGDRYVMEQLLAHNWALGGENSGHVICREKVTTGDAIVAALQILAVIKESNQSLEQLLSDLTMLPQVLINVRFAGESSPLESDLVKQAVLSAEEALRTHSDLPTGRVLLRKSGTEPLIRVMVEAKCADSAQHWAEYIASAVKEA